MRWRGETFIMLAAHELKRLGLARKILITFRPSDRAMGYRSNRLYPDMRVLACRPTTSPRSARHVSQPHCHRGVDVIICAHTSFGFIETGSAAKEFYPDRGRRTTFLLEEMKRKSTSRAR